MKQSTNPHLITLSIVALMAVAAAMTIVLFAGSRPGVPSAAHDFTADVWSQKNLSYCNSNDRYQRLDFYRPKGRDNETLPLLVYVHGGGWRSGDKNNPMLHTYAPLFLRHSMAVATINYRLRPHSPYPDQNNDVACALTYLNKNAGNLRIDPERTILFGESAGGQLASFAALNIPKSDDSYAPPIGVIDFYGVTDFSKIIDGPHPDYNARRYLGTKYNQYARAASPATYVTEHAPRFLVVHGDADKVVPISQSRLLYDSLTRAGIDAEYVALPGAKHGFTGPELSPKSYAIIQDNLVSFLQETINQ